MSIKTFRIGAAQVYVPTRVNTAVPDLTTVPILAAATTPDDLLNNSTSPTLDTSASYYVALAPLAEDRTYGGLTWTGASTGVGPITVTTGQAIGVTISASALPANLVYAYAMAMFLRKNNGQYKLVDYAYIDMDNGFEALISTDADAESGYDLSTLMSTAYSSSYPGLGIRKPGYGVTYTQYDTSGGVQVDIQGSGVQMSPDNGRDYTIPTGHISALRFSIMQNDMKQIVAATAGKFGTWNKSGKQYSQANMSFASAIAQITGNIPFKIKLPPDQNKVREIKLFLAMISLNSANVTLNWSRDNATLIPFEVNPNNQDALLNDVCTEVSYKYRVMS
jgi:hypothetical protein